MSRSRSRKQLQFIFFMVLGFLSGLFYAILKNGLSDMYALINSCIIGILLGILTAQFELNIYPAFFRKFQFLKILAVRTAYYVVVIISTILVVIITYRMIRYEQSFAEVITSEDFIHYIKYEDFIIGIVYAAILIMAVNFIRQMHRVLGFHTLISLITGKYVIPVKKNKIIMFSKIRNTNKLIEKLGRNRFNEFMNEFIYHITTPIKAYHGELYEYYDDQVIVAWDLEYGKHDGNCIRAFFEAKDLLYFKKEKYMIKYGIAPELVAAFHCGPVIKGEIGVIKSEIKYSGDLMNTTSRLLDWCVTEKRELVISKSLFSSMNLPVIFDHEFVGNFIPKGKMEPIEAVAIFEKELITV